MRAFVIGNGPSLKRTNLDKLIGEVTFSCNNIHLIYPYTKWRTTHYVRAEEATTLGYEDWGESVEVHKKLGCEIWANQHFGRIGHDIRTCSHYRRHYNDPDSPHLWHLPMLCTFGSSVNVAVQIAHLQGYSPIYLVGCDLGYENGKANHFEENYEHGKEQEARYANLDTLQAHIIASRSGVEIYNATIGGFLEVYPRVDYETI